MQVSNIKGFAKTKKIRNASVSGGRDAALRRPVGAARRPSQSICAHHRRITKIRIFPLTSRAYKLTIG